MLALVCVCVFEHSAALKEEKPFDSSLQGVSDSFGLERSKCLGLHKDSWASEWYFREILKPLKQAVCLEYMLIFHAVAEEKCND